MRAFRSRTLGPALIAALATTGFAGAAHAASTIGPPATAGGAAKTGQDAPPPVGGEAGAKL